MLVNGIFKTISVSSIDMAWCCQSGDCDETERIDDNDDEKDGVGDDENDKEGTPFSVSPDVEPHECLSTALTTSKPSLANAAVTLHAFSKASKLTPPFGDNTGADANVVGNKAYKVSRGVLAFPCRCCVLRSKERRANTDNRNTAAASKRRLQCIDIILVLSFAVMVVVVVVVAALATLPRDSSCRYSLRSTTKATLDVSGMTCHSGCRDGDDNAPFGFVFT